MRRINKRHEQWLAWSARQDSLDRKKQSAFYVNVTKTGEIGLQPELITRDEASEAIKRAEYLSESPITLSDEYKNLKENSSP